MNDTVDTRVVRMEFDNRQFEKNIKKTSASLENLKRNLDFKGVGDGIDEIKLKISALNIATTTFIANISNRIVNMGVMLVKSLSVDNIASGWNKFGEKTISVATMMAQKIRVAGQEITDLGEKTKVVDEQLELLTWFSDETSYSFNDMVNSVGKFTAAGQDLDVSVKAMEGIATWAALSGQNAQTASRAMYQLAQAMGKGKIQLMDWRSIQNANMDTEEFREVVLSTASAIGELTKEGDKFVTKTGKKFTQSQFTEMLQEGWFTSEVLVKSLGKYSAAIDEIYEISQKEGLLASEVVEKYGDQLDAFGVKAFKAAQEARTFLDVINAIKDAVTSKWMTTFENIFGNREEAVKLWSDLANELYDVFAESGNFRNDILSVWKSLGGREDLFAKGGDNQGAFWNLYDAIIAVRDLIKSAWNTVFPLTEMTEYSAKAEDIGNKFRRLTTRIREITENLKMSEATTLRLSKIFQGLFNILKLGWNTIKAIRYIVDPIFELGKRLVNEVLDQIIYFGSRFSTVGSKLEYIANRIRDLVISLIEGLNNSALFNSILNFTKKIYDLIADYRPITRLVNHIKTFIDSLRETTNLKNDFTRFFTMVKNAFLLVGRIVYQTLTVAFKLLPILSKVLNFAMKAIGYIIGVASKLINVLSTLFGYVFEFLAENRAFENAKNSVVGFFQTVYERIKPLIDILVKAAIIVGNFLRNILMNIPKILQKISDTIKNSDILGFIGKLLRGFVTLIGGFISDVGKVSGKLVGGLGNAIKVLFNGLFTFIKSLIPVLEITFKVLGKLLELVGNLIKKVANTILNVLSGKDIGGFTKIVLTLALIAQAFTMIYFLVWTIKSTILPIHALIEGITDVCDSIYSRLKAGAFDRLAEAILKIAISLALIASINDKDLVKALTALTIISGIMIGIMAVLGKMATSTKIIQRRSRSITKAITGIFDQVRENMQARQNYTKVNVIVGAISSLTTSLIKAAAAILILSKIPEKGLYRALLAAGGILGFLTGLIILSNKLFGKNVIKDIVNIQILLKTMSGLTTSLFGIALSLLILSKIPTDRIATSVLGIATTLLTMAAVLKIATEMGKSTKSSHRGILRILELVGMMILVAGALKLLSTNTVWYNMLSAAGAIIAVISALAGIGILITKFAGSANMISFIMFASAMQILALSMIPMSAALKILSGLNQNGAWNGVGVISVMLLAISIITKTITPVDSIVLTLFSTALTIFAGAMATMSAVIGALALLDPNKVWNGVFAITAMLALFAVASKLVNILSAATMIVFSMALIKFGAAMAIMAAVIGTLSLLKASDIWKGIAAIAGFIALVALSSKLHGLLSVAVFGMFSTALLTFAGAMTILSGCIIALGSMDAAALQRGKKAITNFVGVIAMSSKLHGLLSVAVFGMFSTALLTFGGAMTILSGVILVLGNMDAAALKRGRGTILGFLALMALITKLIGPLQGVSLTLFAAGLLVLSAAIIPFTKALEYVASVDLKALKIGMLGFAIALGVMIAAGYLAAPVIPVIVALAGALALFGIGILATGLGLTALAAGIVAMSAAFTVAFESVKQVIKDFALLIVDIFMDAIDIIVSRLDEIIPKIFSVITNLIDGILMLLTDKGPDIILVAVSLIDNLLEKLADHSESIFNSIFKLLTVLLDKLSDNIGKIADSLFKILLGILDSLVKFIPDIVVRLVDIVSEIFKSLMKEMDKLINTVVDSLMEFVIKLLTKLSKVMVSISGMVAKIILTVLAASIRIVISSLASIGQVLTTFVGALLLTILNIALGMTDVIYEFLRTMLYNVLKLTGKVVRNAGPDIVKSLGSLLKNILSGLLNTLAELLKDIPLLNLIPFGDWGKALADSAEDMFDEAIVSGENVINSIKTTGKNLTTVVQATAQEAKNAAVVGISGISSAVADATSEFSDMFSDVGEELGLNLTSGLTSEVNKNSGEQAGVQYASGVIDGFKEEAEIHSPSKVFRKMGEFLMKGLSIGISKSEGETTSVIEDIISKSLNIVDAILNNQNGDDLTIKVGMDISSVEAQSARIQDIMSGVSNPNLTPSGINAGYNSAFINSRYPNKGSSAVNNTTNNSSEVTYQNTFNITASDPQQTAEEIDRILQQQAMRNKLARGN